MAFGDSPGRGSDQYRYRHGVRPDDPLRIRRVGLAEGIEHVCQFIVLQRTVCVHDFPECRRLGRRCLGVKVGDVELGQVSCDMLEAAVTVVAPQLVPIFRREFLLLVVGPDHEVPTVVRSQIDPVSLMVRRDDHADAIGNVVLSQMLFVDPQRRRRCGHVVLGVLVELEAVEFAEVTRFVDPVG